MQQTVLRLALLIAGTALLLWAGQPASAQRKSGVVLAPKNQQQLQAANLLMQASQFFKAKKFFQARPLLEQAAALWPESPHVHFNLGICYSEIGQFQRAIDEYQTTLRIDPQLTECLPNIGSCYQLMDQPHEAVVWFQRYLQEDPHAPDAAQVRGMIAALDKAANKLVDSDPNNTDYLSSVSPQGHIQRWQPEKLPLKVFISNGRDMQGHAVRGFREYYNEMLLDALNIWMRASNQRLSYVLTDDAHQADIVCTWTDRKDFLQGQGNAVEQGVAQVSARMKRDGSQFEIGHVNVIVLIADQSGNNVSDDVLKKACLHELGHALGFAGHSPSNKDVMFFSESPTVWASLTKRDKATMARLYADYPPAGGIQNSFMYLQPAATDGQGSQPRFN